MRHVGIVVALLAAGMHLPACAVGGSTRELRGQSGSVSWEIVDIRQGLEDNGRRMSWTFSLVLRNTGNIPIAFEHMELGTRTGGTRDYGISGGMGTAPFAERLEPGAETRTRLSHSWGCSECAPAHLHQFFSDGIIVHYTAIGRDDTGGGVRVPIAIPLNSSVGERQ